MNEEKGRRHCDEKGLTFFCFFIYLIIPLFGDFVIQSYIIVIVIEERVTFWSLKFKYIERAFVSLTSPLLMVGAFLY